MVSVNHYCIIIFLSQLLILRNYNIGSKFLNFREVLFQGMFYIDRQNLCKYGWDNLFRKSSIVKGCGGENLVVNNSDRNKLVAEVYKSLREQRNKLMLGLALKWPRIRVLPL